MVVECDGCQRKVRMTNVATFAEVMERLRSNGWRVWLNKVKIPSGEAEELYAYCPSCRQKEGV